MFYSSSSIPAKVPEFLALDFETANYQSNSACAIGLVRVRGDEIIDQAVHLIQPPSKFFQFTGIHGITWDDVAGAATFGELWPRIHHFFEDIDFVAAHNSGFDQKVLYSCCEFYQLDRPRVPFLCTVRMARTTWKLFPTKLSDVCRYLDIELNHHEALSDALACAKIVIAAQRTQREKSPPSSNYNPSV